MQVLDPARDRDGMTSERCWPGAATNRDAWILDAYAAADQDKSIKDRRYVVIHGSLMTREQIVRAKHLGVRVDAQNVFIWDKAAAVERNMGTALANRAVPSRWLVDTLGIEGTAAGTDNQVNILNPFVGLYIMVTRKDPTGKVYGADQALTREEALRLYTNAGPYYTFDERRKGAIEVGKLADMGVLSDDYLTVPESLSTSTPRACAIGCSTKPRSGSRRSRSCRRS